MAITNFIHPYGDVKYAAIAASSNGNNEVVAAVSGKRIIVLSYKVVINAAVNCKWRSANADITGLDYGDAQGWGSIGNFSPVGHFVTAVGEALNLNLSSGVAVGGHLTYVEAA